MSDLITVAELDPALKDLRDPATYTPRFSGRAVTIVGLRTATTRFVPKSHEGFSNEAYVDKEWILGDKRAAFTARKQKATERRSHMRLLRQHLDGPAQLAGKADSKGKFEEKDRKIVLTANEDWHCELPHLLCLRCPNCTLFGGLRPGSQFALLARARYQDSFSLEPTRLCVANEESDSGDMGVDGMAIGNTQSERLHSARSSSSFFYYEYVRPGTHFPFVLTILDPSVLDVAGTLAAIDLASVTGYGSYSSNQGKFRTHLLGLAIGLPRFSVLDMIDWTRGLWSERENLGNDAVYVKQLGTELNNKSRWLANWFQAGSELTVPAAEVFGAEVGKLNWAAASLAVLRNYSDLSE